MKSELFLKSELTWSIFAPSQHVSRQESKAQDDTADRASLKGIQKWQLPHFYPHEFIISIDWGKAAENPAHV